MNLVFDFSCLVDVCVPGEVADVTGIVKLSSRDDRNHSFVTTYFQLLMLLAWLLSPIDYNCFLQ